MKNNNILFITHTYTTFQKSQIEGIANQFNQVFVLVRYKPVAEISRFLPLRYLRLHNKEHSINLRNTPENVHVIPMPIFYFPCRRSYLRLGDRLYKKAKNLIENYSIKFDLIHAHYFWTSGYIGLKLKQDFHTPVVITNHSTHQLTKYLSRNPIWKKKMTETITGADHIFVVNNFMKKKVLEISSELKVDVTPAGFNENLFFPIKKETAREQLGLPNNYPIILNISSLDDNKNVVLFIEGISKILPIYPDLRGIIIGDGKNYKKLWKLIKDLELEKHIKLIGAIPHHSINQWINASDFVTLCSFIEGSPTVMYESLACGKPFLGSAVGGIPEIITSKDYGCVFDPNQLMDFVKKMDYMLRIEWDRDKILAYSSQFSQKKISQDVIQVYKKLLLG